MQLPDDPREAWFKAMKQAVVTLSKLASLTPRGGMDVKSRPLAAVFASILHMAYLLVTSDSWKRRTLTPLEAVQLARHLKDDLLPLIERAAGEYIERRRAEEFAPTSPPTSEHPCG